MTVVSKNPDLYDYLDVVSKSRLSDLNVEEIRLVNRVVEDFIDSGLLNTNERYCVENLSMYVLQPWLTVVESGRSYSVIDSRTIGQLKIIHDSCVYAIDNGIYDSVNTRNVDELRKFLENMLKHDYGSDKDFSQYKYNSTK